MKTEEQPAILLSVYEKYRALYGEDQGEALREMINKARRLGESSCSLFEEHASAFDPSLTADHLECLFERGLDTRRPSIQSCIESRLDRSAYRHILKFRVALTRDCIIPAVCVHYVLVWKKSIKKEEEVIYLQ